MIGQVQTPVWRLMWSGTDITTDIAGMVTSLTYTDKKEGESDELTVVLEDHDGRWRGLWRPAKGHLLDLTIGYQGGVMIDAGRFEVDEVEHDGPPDRLHIRALAAGITEALRTTRHRAFEGQTLSQIATTIAGDHGMTVIGDPATAALKRISQADETDLAFLARLAAEHGYVFSVRGNGLVFMLEEDLLSAAPVMVLSRSAHDPVRWEFRAGSKRIYKGCEVTYQHPDTRQTERVAISADGAPWRDTEAGFSGGDLLKKRVRVESEAHARQKARALLTRHNRDEITASLTLPGQPMLVAGSNVELAGFGDAWNGTYHVTRASHRMARAGGYSTEMEGHRV